MLDRIRAAALLAGLTLALSGTVQASGSTYAKTAILQDAWAERDGQPGVTYDSANRTKQISVGLPPAMPNTTASTQRDQSLPAPDLLKPILPDLSEDSIPGRVSRIVRVIIGLIGLGVLIYGMVRMLFLAWEALTGTRSVRSLLGQLAVYVLTFVGVLALLHGFMLETIIGVYQFFSGL